MTEKRKILPLIFIAFLVLVLPIALMLMRQRQELRKKAYESGGIQQVNLRVNPTTVSIGNNVDVYIEGNNESYAYIQGKIIYDTAYFTPVGPITSVLSSHRFGLGDASIFYFGANNKSSLLSGQILKLTLRATKAGLTSVSIGPNGSHIAKGVKLDGSIVNFTSTLGAASGISVAIAEATPTPTATASPTPVVIVTATPLAGTPSFSPSCGNRGTTITITGPNLGTEGKVCLVKEATIGYPCGYNMATSRTNTQIVATIPTNLRDDEITTPFSIRIETKASAGSSDYITPALMLTVSTNCAVVTPPPTTAPTATPGVTAPPTATPRITPTPTPTATPPPVGSASLTLVPASTTIGSSPVLIQVKLNSGEIAVASAQSVIIVDSKLSVVDVSGNAVTSIVAGDTSLSYILKNTVVSNVISFSASKASPQTAAAAVNGTFAKFYVKALQTSGTATLTFKTGNTGDDSMILTNDAENILGSTTPLSLSLGTPTSVAGDVNGNGCVGLYDLSYVAGHYQTSSQCTPSRAPSPIGPASNGDFNNDGCVDGADYTIVNERANISCNE